MADVLTREAVAGCVDRAPAGELYEFVVTDLAASHEELRTRLESAEAALRKTEPYLVNVYLNGGGYVCVICRAEATTAESIIHPDDCPLAALGAAGEENADG